MTLKVSKLSFTTSTVGYPTRNWASCLVTVIVIFTSAHNTIRIHASSSNLSVSVNAVQCYKCL